ncbi:MAG: choice-of-anchor D domain-containing protein [Limisphaerales bacterium]
MSPTILSTLTLTGSASAIPVPVIGVQQPVGTNLVNNVSTNNFGLVTVGSNTSLTFVITNTGNANLTGLGILIDGTDAASFIVTTNPAVVVNPGSNTTFTVRFAPLTPGAKSAALHLANNDVTNNPFNLTLTGSASAIPIPVIGVQQPVGTNLVNGVSTNNFGLVTVGNNASLTFTITNTGNANLTGLAILIDGADAASFIVTTNPVTPVTPNGSTTFTVRFAPLTSGAKTATLHLANNDVTNNPFNLTLTGSGAAIPLPRIGVQQPVGTNLVNGFNTNNFGTVVIGTNASLTFTVTNSGNANLTGLAILIDGTDAASFIVTTNPAVVVNPGSNTTFTVRFAPLTPGAKTATLHLANNDAANNPFNLTLTGSASAIPVPVIGVQQPAGTNLVNNATTNNFGLVTVGNNNSLTFTVTNTGNANLTGLAILIDGADAASFIVTTNPVTPVTPNGSTTFTVRFAPLTSGAKTATLHLANNDLTNNPFNLTLTGSGAAIPLPRIGVQQPVGTNLVNGFNTNNFGTVVIGTNASLTFTVTNSGNANLTGLAILIDGADAASFVVTANPAAIVNPGSNTTFTVRFAPLTSGAKIATLHLANNDVTNNPFNLTLTGSGAAIPIAIIGVQQPVGTNLVNGFNTNNFGTVVIGTNASLTFTVTNSGNANLTGLAILIDGTDAALLRRYHQSRRHRQSRQQHHFYRPVRPADLRRQDRYVASGQQ